jgi:hypothetical protein
MLQETPANETAPEPVEPEEPEPDAIPVPVPEPEKAIDLDVVIKELNAVPTKYGLKIENKGTYSEEQKTAIWKIFDKSATAKEDGFIKAVVKFAVAQNGKVASAVKSVKEEDDIKKALDSVFNDESNEALKRSLAPSWIASMEVGRKNADDLLGKKKAVSSVAVTNVLFNKWVNKAGLLKAKEINETTYEKLLKDLQVVMSESVGAGDGIAVMVGKLLAATENVYDNMSKSRAVLIARTESASSMNFGTVKTYETAGVEKKTWLSTRDDRTRDEHAVMMDITVGINEKFDVGGELLDYPGDPEGSAGNICNCRCTIIAEID